MGMPYCHCSDFSGSGYDRGHLAPAANHSIDKQRMSETFSLINISPQVRSCTSSFIITAPHVIGSALCVCLGM